MNLTVNQIIVLLDIYRGTETQKEIGTSFADSMKLQKLGLVEPSKNKSGLSVTVEGNNLVCEMNLFVGKQIQRLKDKEEVFGTICPYCLEKGNHCTDVEAETCINNPENN